VSVIVQAGHVNIEENCDWGLRGQTGAPGERDFTARVAAIVAGALQGNGVACVVADANANCVGTITNRDYDAFLALHCDARHRSGFAVGVGNHAEDGAAQSSARLGDCLRKAYGQSTGLADVNDLGENPNVTEYYMFNSLSQATPCALIEMGAISAPDGSYGPDELYMSTHAEDVASGIVNGLLDFLKVDYSTVTPPAGASPHYDHIPDVTPPNLSGPPPALIPSAMAQLPDALTNLGEAKKNGLALLDVDQVESLGEHRPTLVAMVNQINVAIGLLGGA